MKKKSDSAAPVKESMSPAAADAALDPVIGSVAPEIECLSPAAACAAPAPLIDSGDPVIESMSPAPADAATDPVMEYVTSALAEPIPVDEHASKEQLTAAAAARWRRCLPAQEEEKRRSVRPRRPNARSVDMMTGPFHTISYDGDVEYQVTSGIGVIRVMCRVSDLETTSFQRRAETDNVGGSKNNAVFPIPNKNRPAGRKIRARIQLSLTVLNAMMELGACMSLLGECHTLALIACSRHRPRWRQT